MSTQNLLENIYDRMGTKDTAELIAIWQENDHGLWSDSAFEVIEKLLLERGVTFPNQGEIKVTIPPTPKFEIPWHIPYLSWLHINLPWGLFGVFLMWVFLIHPFYFFTYFSDLSSHSSNPLALWPNWTLRLNAMMTGQNSATWIKLFSMFRYVEFGLMSYGILVGCFVLRKMKMAIFMMKSYLIQLFLFAMTLLLLFNIYPLLNLYWEVQSSVLNLEPNWDLWLDTLNRNSIGPNSRSTFFLATLKVYCLPITTTIIWYVFLIRSNWIATTFPPNPPAS